MSRSNECKIEYRLLIDNSNPDDSLVSKSAWLVKHYLQLCYAKQSFNRKFCANEKNKKCGGSFL